MTEPYVNPAEIPVKRNENVALGVLGALLFSVAGGLAHFGLMQFGYIAAISALVGMAASYFGYGLFSGRKNTVHGAILAVVFTMLMIVAAEYFTLAKEVFDVFKEEYEITFRDALAATPAFLEDPDVRSGVLKDLGFALVFSIMEAFSSSATPPARPRRRLPPQRRQRQKIQRSFENHTFARYLAGTKTQSRPEGEAQRENVRRSFTSACLKAEKAFPVSGTRKRGVFMSAWRDAAAAFCHAFSFA